MRTFAQRHPMAAFLVLAYLSAAVIFALPLLSNAGLGVIDLELPGLAPFVLLSALALAAAAFVTTSLADGRDGVRDLRRRVFRFRVHPGWYAATFLLPATAIATAVVFAGIDPIIGLVSSPGMLLGTVLAGALVAFVLVNWWEEAAWTGFALHRLQPRMGPIAASVVTTWLQAMVHLPLVFVAGGVTDGRVPADQIPFYLVGALHPADLRPAGDHVDLQRQRPQCPDRRPLPRRPRSGDRQRVHPGAGAERRSDLGLRRIRCARGSGSARHPWPTRLCDDG